MDVYLDDKTHLISNKLYRMPPRLVCAKASSPHKVVIGYFFSLNLNRFQGLDQDIQIEFILSSNLNIAILIRIKKNLLV